MTTKTERLGTPGLAGEFRDPPSGVTGAEENSACKVSLPVGR
jgi:hypothetical protein